jgi:hypothetical protein
VWVTCLSPCDLEVLWRTVACRKLCEPHFTFRHRRQGVFALCEVLVVGAAAACFVVFGSGEDVPAFVGVFVVLGGYFVGIFVYGCLAGPLQFPTAGGSRVSSAEEQGTATAETVGSLASTSLQNIISSTHGAVRMLVGSTAYKKSTGNQFANDYRTVRWVECCLELRHLCCSVWHFVRDALTATK